MKMIKKTAVGIGLMAALISSPAAASGHCTAQEITVFSCKTSKKTVSVCASSDIKKTSGALQYRFGVVGATPLEMVYPNSSTHPNATVSAGSLVYSGGGGAYMRFSNVNYSYVVYSGFGKGWEKEGLAIEINDKISSSFPCKGKVENIMGVEFFEKAGLTVDGTNDFDMFDAR